MSSIVSVKLIDFYALGKQSSKNRKYSRRKKNICNNAFGFFRKETIYVEVEVHGKNKKEGHHIEIRLE